MDNTSFISQRDVYLYNNSNLSEKKNKKTIPLVITIKRTNLGNLGINLTKKPKNLYSKTINSLMKESRHKSKERPHVHELEE